MSDTHEEKTGEGGACIPRQPKRWVGRADAILIEVSKVYNTASSRSIECLLLALGK